MMSFGGISLGMKSEKIFDNIEFKFKKMQFKNMLFGVLLLKLDETFYSCFVSLDHSNSKLCLKKLINLDAFNFIVFDNSYENKIYRVLNDFKNKLLFSISNHVTHNFEYSITSNELKNQFSAEMLWNN